MTYPKKPEGNDQLRIKCEHWIRKIANHAYEIKPVFAIIKGRRREITARTSVTTEERKGKSRGRKRSI